ncbi:MAG: helix-turn-helix domain-containing protein [Acidimicrobiales bacterium]
MERAARSRGVRERVKRRGLEEKRARVVRLLERGLRPGDVAAASGVGRSTVYGWWSACQKLGERSFVVGKAKGAVPKLSPAQVARLRRTILGSDFSAICTRRHGGRHGRH